MDVLSVAGVAALAIALPAAVSAQAVLPERHEVAVPALAAGPAAAPANWLLERSWVRPVVSLLVPGGGQLLARQERGVAYLAAEVWVIARAVALDQRGRRDRERYQDLAFRVARRRYSNLRRDGPFTYYESMERYVESGVYDADTGPAFLPEPDTSTFNGSLWLLARRTFLADPESLPAPTSPAYQAALGFYQAHAVPPAFQWTWRDARLEQDVFRQTIRASDEAFRSATNYLGALVVNHLISAVDALIAVRRGRPPALPAVEVSPDDVVSLAWRLSF